MRIYIAGPMRGIPYFNAPAFDGAAALLRGKGHSVSSPVEHTRAKHGDIFKNNPAGDETLITNFNRREIFCDDLTTICLDSDAIAMLPNWENSQGATAEYAVATALGLEVIEFKCDSEGALWLTEKL